MIVLGVHCWEELALKEPLDSEFETFLSGANKVFTSKTNFCISNKNFTRIVYMVSSAANKVFLLIP